MTTVQRTISAEAVDPIQLALNRKAYRSNLLMQILPFAGFIFLFVFFLIATQGKIISASNLSVLVDQCFTISVVAVGATFVYAFGAFDISVGNVMAFGQLIITFMMIAGGFPVLVILLAGIGVTVGCTFVTGFITAFLRVPAFIVSLCMMNICQGIVQTAVTGSNLYIPYNDYSFLNEPLLKAIALILVVAAGLIVFNKTRLGRDLKALGGNEVAAQQSGINKRRVILIGFFCLGVCLGVAALFSTVSIGMITGTTGSGLGLSILVAIVLGGFPLTGGPKSRMIGAIIGALTVTLLGNGMGLIGVDPSVSLFIQAMLFITIVTISYDRSRGKLIS